VFYTVAINHYQQKKGGGDKNKIEALTQEAIRSYGYKLGSYRFGADNRYVHIEDGILYPSLSSIKGFSQRVADSLWQVWQEHEDAIHDFLDVLVFLNDQSTVNTTQISDLISVDYFSEYGSDGKLLDFLELFKELYGAKVISLKKAEKLHLDMDELGRFGKRTEKTVRNIDSLVLLRHYLERLQERKLPIRMKLKAEQKVLGVMNAKVPDADKSLFYVVDIEPKPKIVYASFYEIRSGILWDVKFWRSELERQDVIAGDLVYVGKLEQKVKRRPPTPEEEEKLKSSKWIPEPGSYETWAKSIRVMGEE
jgi:hypothetical protein